MKAEACHVATANNAGDPNDGVTDFLRQASEARIKNIDSQKAVLCHKQRASKEGGCTQEVTAKFIGDQGRSTKDIAVKNFHKNN
jgi:hypothetical protein